MTTKHRSAGLDELDEIDAAFNALSAPARRQILLVLKARGGSMTSKEVAERFETTWATTSRHLRSLEQAGFLRVEQTGRERRYHLETKRIQDTIGNWIQVLTTSQQA